MSAIVGLPTTMVETLSGSFMSVAWSSTTSTASAAPAMRGRRNADSIRAMTAVVLRARVAFITAFSETQPAGGSAHGANRRGGFDCKLVNEVQMQRLRGIDDLRSVRSLRIRLRIVGTGKKAPLLILGYTLVVENILLAHSSIHSVIYIL